MATRKLSTVLSITGEQEYRKKLDDVNKDLTLLRSKMNLVTKTFKGNESSVDALSAKNEVLSKKYETQEAKIKLVRDQLEKSAEELGKNDSKTKDLQITLNYAEAALVDLDRELAANREALEAAREALAANREELEENREALEKAAEAAEDGDQEWSDLQERFEDTEDDSKGLGDALNDLTGKLGIELPGGVTNAVNGLGKINPATAVAVAGVGSLLAGVVSLGKKIGELTVESAAWADEITTLSGVTGVSAVALQEYEYIASKTGLGIDNITDALKETTNSIKAATEGSEEQIAAFDRLGVSYQNADGTLRSADAVFRDIIASLGEMQAGTDRDIIAMSLLSESAQTLNPLIDTGAEKIDEMAQEAHELGKVLDEDAIKSLDETDRAVKTFCDSVDGAKNKLAAEFAPIVKEVMEDCSGWVKEFGDAIEVSGAEVAFRGILETVGLLSGEAIPELDNALRPLVKTITVIVDLVNAANALFPSLTVAGVPIRFDETPAAEQLYQALGLLVDEGKYNHAQELERYWAELDAERAAEEALNAYKDGLNDNVRDVLYGTESEKNAAIKKMIGSSPSSLTAKLEEMYYAGIGHSPEEDMTLDEYINKYWDQYAKQYGYSAGGTPNWRGGWTWVGENGPELVHLPQGSAVVTAQESQSAGDTYYITIDAKSVKEFNDIVRIAQSQRRTMRMSEG